jgi:hypothetical protein
MPVSKTLVETWVCNTCGRGESHVLGTGANLAAAHFVERLGWQRNDAGDVAICDRCIKAGFPRPTT